MRKNKTVKTIILCAAIAVTMFVGATMPRVYAAYYETSDVETDVTDGNAGRKIHTVGTYELQPGVIYTLQGNLTHVEGDATVYANHISFTVNTHGWYTFNRNRYFVW